MKIVIVGGGTAGWLSALYMSRFNQSKKNEIIVIESSTVPIIGAGEGSTGILPRTINNNFVNMGIDELQFLYNTEATQKLGINLKDWNGIGTQFYSPIQPTNTALDNTDFDLLVSMIMGNYYDSSPSGYLQANGYSAYTNNKTNFTAAFSYHFDAHKVGEYLKSVALKYGVKCIDTEVTSLNKNSVTGELQSIETNNGNIDADFWIDCSGFARVLIDPMGGGWKSYSEYLPVNGAIPYIHQFEEDKDIRLETLSWAMPNGWMWQIPTQKRYGCGYVYSDMFTTYDKAVDELIKTTGRNIEPLKNLKFKCGRLENFWVKNVVAVGLSAGFVEPLEATSIHTTIVQLDILLSNSLNFQTNINNVVNESNIKKFNNHFIKMFDDVKDLIQMHYITEREDTEFWKYCKYEMKLTDKVKEILDICKYRAPGGQDFDMYHGGIGWGVWCWTVVGLGHLSVDVAKKTLESYGNIDTIFKSYFQNIKHKNSINAIKAIKSDEFVKALINKKLK
jgi:tryptophan halogenase